jgi:hypothetical protein
LNSEIAKVQSSKQLVETKLEELKKQKIILKAERKEYKKKEAELVEKKKSFPSETMNAMVELNSHCHSFQWGFETEQNEMKLSNLLVHPNSSCRNCKKRNIQVVYLNGHEMRTSLCKECIEWMFQNGTSTVVDMEEDLRQLKTKIANIEARLKANKEVIASDETAPME